MAKRITDRNLCDMNWNHDDDYPIASEGVLKNREIKKAVRRNAGGEGEGPRALRGFDGIPATTTTSAGSGAAAPAFLGFGNGTMSSFSLSGLTHANSFTPLTGGFSSPNHTTPALALNDPAASKPTASFGAFYSPAVTANANLAPAWALGAAASKPTAADVTSKQTFDGSSLTRIASNSSISCSSSTGSSIFNNSPSSSSILNSTSIPSSNTSNNIFNSTNTSSSSSITSSLNSANTSSVNEDYNRELAALNCSVRDWITKHVDVNPLLDLSPVFRDYERHLANVEHKYSGVEAEAAAAGAAAGSATVLEGLADSQASEEKQWALPPTTSTATSLSSSSSSSSSDGTRLFSFGLKDHGRSSPDKSGASSPGSLLSCFGQQVDTSATGSAGTHLPATVPTPLLPFSSGSPPDPHDKNKDIFSSGSPPDPHDKNKDIFSSGSPLFAFNKNRDTFSSSSIPFSYDKHATFGPSSSGPFGQAPMFRAPQAFSAESVAPPLPSSCAGGVIGAETVQPTHDNGANTESDEPPKPEVTEVKETDAFYSKRCKLFYKKESEYKEKGVGTLHLKLTPGGKTQLIVRADTNLGNILLNIVLQASVPCSRVGKNNVLVVCVPNPSVDDKNPGSPLPLLIRVKTTEEADELHKLLEEKKVL